MSADLQREIESLRERLDQAEDLRRAISVGEVDAFVVGHSDEDKQVLLVAGAYSRYRQLFDEIHQGTVTVTARGEILFANQHFARMLGCRLTEVFRTSLESFVRAKDRAAVAALLTAPGGQDAMEVGLLRRDGSPLRAQVSVVSCSEAFTTLIVTDSGEAQIVTEAQETIDAIRRGQVDAFVVGGETVVTLSNAADPYQVLADRIQQGALTVSVAGNVVYANSRLSRMLGLPVDRMLGSAFTAMAFPADRSALAAVLTGKSAQAEVKLRRFDGTAVETLISVAMLAGGQRMYLVTDLSEQKRHKASDERSRKFLAMLAHEFRNMLNAVRLSLEVLKLQELNPDCRKAVESIERQSGRMLQLVEDLRAINPKN